MLVVVETTSVCLVIHSTYQDTHLEYRGRATCMAGSENHIAGGALLSC